jgi:hypothetical protein
VEENFQEVIDNLMRFLSVFQLHLNYNSSQLEIYTAFCGITLAMAKQSKQSVSVEGKERE